MSGKPGKAPSLITFLVRNMSLPIGLHGKASLDRIVSRSRERSAKIGQSKRQTLLSLSTPRAKNNCGKMFK
jgi:hypothetical protein